MSDALKPCPFCGTTEMLRIVGAQPGEGYSFVRCDYCDAEGPDPESLPGHWNTRTSPDDDWTRWKMGESTDALAKERGCTRERMRHRLKRLDEGRSVLAMTEALAAKDAQIAALASAGRALADHGAMQDREYLSLDLNEKLDAMRAALAKIAQEE